MLPPTTHPRRTRERTHTSTVLLALSDDTGSDKRAEFAAALEAYVDGPAGRRRPKRFRQLKKAIGEQEARSIEGAKAIAAAHAGMARARQAVAAAERAEQLLEESRHRELVDALKEGNARSWRRDIVVAAIGAAFGAIATVIVSLLT